MRRELLVSGAGLLMLLLTGPSCLARPRGEVPHAGLASVWREFESLPESRALAVAGDPDRIWVGAAVGDAPSPAAAEQQALAECHKRRLVGRVQDPCRVYASGDEIVWDPFGLRTEEDGE